MDLAEEEHNKQEALKLEVGESENNFDLHERHMFPSQFGKVESK